MPAVISAATGSKDRQELETMAGQATQVQRERRRQLDRDKDRDSERGTKTETV